MTAPNRDLPDRAYTGSASSGQHIVGIQSWNETTIRNAQRAPIEAAWSGARGALFGNIIGGIANAIRGVFGPGEAFRPVADAFQDQQRALNDRIDLLADVCYGYCNLVMSKTWTLNGNALNGYARAMPFDTQIGPNKNARPFYGLFHGSGDQRYGILIEAPGTWRLDTQVTPDAISGQKPVQLYLSAWNRDTRTVYSERRFDTVILANKLSNTISHTVVVPLRRREARCVREFRDVRQLACSGWRPLVGTVCEPMGFEFRR
ncbi:hypothetical protein GS784_06645 [Rhodococcus hoagii]|nr:hypothetical protein [Prescottella equi]